MATFQKRLNALSARVEQEGMILSDEQVGTLERAKDEQVAHGQIETYHPGYIGSQDTYYPLVVLENL